MTVEPYDGTSRPAKRLAVGLRRAVAELRARIAGMARR
jgi:hypothetical protein